jgi:hypothetical protein
MGPRRFFPAVLLLASATLVAVATPPAGAAHRVAHPKIPKTDWYAYHGNRKRTGFDKNMPRFHSGLRVVKRIKLDGAVYASPLVVHGLTIVATENNTLYAFNRKNHQVWRRHLHAPSPQSQRPCGDIDPLGITSTPVYSPITKLVYVAAEYGGSPPRHFVLALNPKTGHVHFKRNIDLRGADSRAMQARGALTLDGGRVWASFGALAGDCDNYKGRVVGVPARGKGKLVRYDPSPHPQGGIWNPNGPTVDSKGHIFVVSANGSTFPGDKYDHTNSVDEINTKGHLIDSFAPSNWAQNNQGDVGLGSQGVAFVGKWVVLGGKSGPVYVLRHNHLGGIGGQVHVKNICLSFGGAAVRYHVIYLPCTDGVRAVRIGPKGGMHVLWHANSSVNGSPVVGGKQVWVMDTNGGVLHALGQYHGVGHGSVNVGQANRFETPALSGRRILIGTLSGLTVVRF